MDTNALSGKSETYFESIIYDVNLRPVKPDPDIEGIDRRVVWTRPGDLVLAPGKSFDTEQPHKRVNVQIKATERKGGVIRVKLSAAKYLVDINEPAFIAVLKYSDSKNPELALFHVHGDILVAILKKLRKCTKHDKKPNKVELSFRFSKGDLINPDGIREYFEEIIGDDIDEYIKQKMSFRKSCGYNYDRYTSNLKVQIDSKKSFIDSLMGRAPLRVFGAEHFEKRFEIPLPSEGLFGEELTEILLSPPVLGIWDICVTKDDGKSITLTGDVTSSYDPSLPEDLIESEWNTGLCRLVMNSERIHIGLNVEKLMTEALMPSVVRESIEFMLYVMEGAKLEINYGSEDGFMFPEMLVGKPEQEFDAEGWLDVVYAVEHILDKSGSDEYPIILNEIDTHEVLTSKALLDPSLTNTLGSGRIPISSVPADLSKIVSQAETIGYVISISIGTRLFALFSMFETQVKKLDSSYEILTGKLLHHSARSLRKGKEQTDFESFYTDQKLAFKASLWMKSYKQDMVIEWD